MDTDQIPTDEEQVKASLIHRDGHWTDPPSLLQQRVKLVHRNSLLGGCNIIYVTILTSP